MSDDKKVIFSMQRLSKSYQGSDKQVLKNIYLSFFYGAKIGILGLNGSGKSTLLKIIAGIDKNVVFSSAVNIIEIWDKDNYEKAIDDAAGEFSDLAEDVMGTITSDEDGIS